MALKKFALEVCLHQNFVADFDVSTLQIAKE
jgi:hypothetical protein